MTALSSAALPWLRRRCRLPRSPTTLHCCGCCCYATAHRLLQAAVKEAEASLAATERQLSEAAGKLAASEKEVAALQAAVQVRGSRWAAERCQNPLAVSAFLFAGTYCTAVIPTSTTAAPPGLTTATAAHAVTS